MVQIKKPVKLSENIIDLRTKAGAAGRAVNRLKAKDAARQLAEQLRQEAILQAMKLRQQRPR